MYVVNPDGATAIFVNGISYSGVPTWTTAAGSLGEFEATFSIQLVATSDSAVTYALTTGSTLPAGVTLSSGGLISGTNNTEQTFSFSVDAIDAQNQETPRSFSVTIVLADPYFNRNVLLLSGNGANNQTNNTFLDSSSNNFTITRNGNTTQGTFSPFSPTGWSNYFDGAGDFLSTPANISAFDFTATKTLTFECWAYFTGFPDNATIFDIAECVPFRIVCSAGGITWQATSSGTTVAFASVALPLNTWNHIACVRDVDAVSIYLNGTRVASTTYSASWVASGATAYVGCNRGNTWFVQGYMSNVRLVKGVAVYSGASYTVPTAPLTAISGTSLLTCQSNRFRDASTNSFAITASGDVSVQAFSPFAPTAAWSAATHGGSSIFDGTGDYLSLASNEAFNMGTGDFTLETWYYHVGGGTALYPSIFSSTDWAGGGVGLRYNNGGTGRFAFFWNGVGDPWLNASFTTPGFQWSHVALTRSGNNFTLWVNGVSAATGTNSGSINFNYNGGGPRVGWGPWDGNNTAPFTPPTTTFTSGANTSLLLNFTNAGIYDATAKNVLETVGDAKISTAQSKFGGSSIFFDGTGDSLTARNNSLYGFGTGDFTVEAWVYIVSATQYACVVGGPSGGQTWYLEYSSTRGFYFYDNGASALNGNSSVVTGAWKHLAVSRSGTTLRMFVDGVLTATHTSSTNIPSVVLAVGAYNDNTYNVNGYIDDLRITRGYARYTANFTPPTTAHKLR